MSEFRIGVIGAAGRMGRMLAREVSAAPGCVLAAACEKPGHESVGRDAGEVAGLAPLGVAITDQPAAMFARVDAAIDFTVPQATAAHAGLAAQSKVIHVIGTTGLDAEQERALHKAAELTPVVWAPNMSLGVNLLIALTRQVAAILGDDYDIEILEMHHRHKVDAPSGTALVLGRAAAAGRGVNLDEVAVKNREGEIGARADGGIGFATLRGGDVVGDHTVIFAGEGERVELSHKAGDRRIFAKGAVKAALWARDKPPGLYGMKDLLGLDG